MLLGFFAAGFIGFGAPVIFVTLCAVQFGAVAWAQHSDWIRKLSDPTLFLPQQLFAISIALGMTLLVPHISAFSFMAPNMRSLIVCWSAGAAGAITVIFFLGPRLAMPTSTLAGQALTGGVVIGLLARCIWIATFVRHLQLRLSEKNAALKAAVERIEVMANRDELTGLANRRAITAWLAEQIDAAGRTGTPLSVTILDIDHSRRSTIPTAITQATGPCKYLVKSPRLRSEAAIASAATAGRSFCLSSLARRSTRRKSRWSASERPWRPIGGTRSKPGCT
jgi:diguanylate cyclase